MIKQVDIIENTLEENLFTIKIKSNFNCYDKFDFCNTYFQEINGKTTAIINILNVSSTVFCYKEADFEEIESFLEFQSVSSIFCNRIFAEYIGINRFNSGVVLKKAYTRSDGENYKFTYNPDYKSIYGLIKNEFELPNYDDFVSDLSFRLKNGFSKIISDEKGVVFSGWETENASVISAIAVDITDRQKGEGSRLLNAFINGCDGKEIYSYCTEKTVEFYQKNGFTPTDNFYFLKGLIK